MVVNCASRAFAGSERGMQGSTDSDVESIKTDWVGSEGLVFTMEQSRDVSEAGSLSKTTPNE
jgi:hypothetical protein